MLQNIAFTLIGLGVLALIGWMVKGFFTAVDIPLLIRIAVGAIGVGGLILVAIAIKDRLKKSERDDFKEVDK
ncbi:MAG TPA: hypothetical protein G4O19_04585 [Dehalococcoidia bacterium]|nr:hypothetical protein [Dehalococcoidia bacterium]